MSLYKNGDHRRCYAKINLCNDIETNPGPPMNNIDPTLAVKAPYSQGDITVCGANAGQQCVAMSLCDLIYNNIKELIHVMNWYKLWKWVINCILHCHNVQGKCI